MSDAVKNGKKTFLDLMEDFRKISMGMLETFPEFSIFFQSYLLDMFYRSGKIKKR